MNKSQINAFLKENFGYGNIRYTGNYITPGRPVRINDNLVKGIILARTGPFDNKDISHRNIKDALFDKGFRSLCDHEGVFFEMENEKYNIRFSYRECRSYESRDMDSAYKTVYLTVSIDKK